MCFRLPRVVFAFLLLVFLPSCGGVDTVVGEDGVCAQLFSQTCTCEGGAKGLQVCKKDGTGFEACVCEDDSEDVEDACANSGDIEALSEADFAAMWSDCAKQTIIDKVEWGANGLLECVLEYTGFSDDCARCYADQLQCLSPGCGDECFDKGVPTAATDTCVACMDSEGCAAALDKCTGPPDCSGEWGGTAVVDDCNECIGGNTGKSACAQDCNGDWGGTAKTDNCDACVGGETGKTACTPDCNDDWGGTAITDECGDCVDGDTGETACVKDCNDDWGGTAALDECGECAGGNTGNSPCIQDCAGDWGGDAVTDMCGECVGGTAGGKGCVQDCDDTWGGSATVDKCGVCDDDASNDGDTCVPHDLLGACDYISSMHKVFKGKCVGYETSSPESDISSVKTQCETANGIWKVSCPIEGLLVSCNQDLINSFEQVIFFYQEFIDGTPDVSSVEDVEEACEDEFNGNVE